MKTVLFYLTLIALAIAPAAAFAQKGSVAVLDIDKVAKELRIDQTVQSELKAIEANLNAQLNQVRANLQAQMTQLETSASQQRTPEAQAQLAAANRKLNADFGNVRAEAQNRLNAARLQRVNDFREKLRPLAKAAAKERGLDVVLTIVPEVYSYDESVDITADVIDRAKKAGMEQPEPVISVPASGSITPSSSPAAPAPAAPAVPKADVPEVPPAAGAKGKTK